MEGKDEEELGCCKALPSATLGVANNGCVGEDMVLFGLMSNFGNRSQWEGVKILQSITFSSGKKGSGLGMV